MVQIYSGGGSEQDAPIRSLSGFQRIHLRAGESREVKLTLKPEDLSKAKVEIIVGGGLPVGSRPHIEGVL